MAATEAIMDNTPNYEQAIQELETLKQEFLSNVQKLREKHNLKVHLIAPVQLRDGNHVELGYIISSS